MPWADFHTHTRYSHGTGTIEDNVREAARKGLYAVGITDHGPSMLGIGIDLRRWERIEKEIRVVQSKYPQVKVLLGVEANLISEDGDLDIPNEIIGRLDLLLVGFHLMVRPASWRDGLRLIAGNLAYESLPRKTQERVRQINTRALIAAVNRYDVDIVTHPGLHLDIDTVKLARACVARNTALEINASHRVPDVGFVRAAAREGAFFVLSSDAHSPNRIGDFRKALQVAEEAGVDRGRVVNLDYGWHTMCRRA